MKLSVSLDDETSQLLLGIKADQKRMVSHIVQDALRLYADKMGYELIPARVIKKRPNGVESG
jgi:hypothetical protein